MTRCALLGASGRMGRAITALIGEGDFAGLTIASTWRSSDENEALVEALSVADIAIDFTTAAATPGVITALHKHPLPIVSGTTGLDAALLDDIDRLGERMPVLHDGNMSIGVAVLTQVVAQAASRLLGYDVEISDIHHRDKRDAPSGTALQLGHAVAEARGDQLSYVTRDSDVAREAATQIGFSAMRGGGVIGEHTVAFLGEHDRLELRHIASDRRLFAAGALRAAQWLVNMPAGRYTVADMLTQKV
ncbi:MAG: 4-hydroxy-tetrahydrodipicolinate reductase [Pseudomonadota bacterium]